MKVKFLDLKNIHFDINEEIVDSVSEVIESVVYIGGTKVVEFENAYAKYLGAKYCIGVANGFDAIRLSLMVLNIKAGD